MSVDSPEIVIRVVTALKDFCKLTSRWCIQLVFLFSLGNVRIRGIGAVECAGFHPANANHEQVGWILGTLQDLIHSCNVVFIRVIALLELLVKHPCMSISELEVVCELSHLRFDCD